MRHNRLPRNGRIHVCVGITALKISSQMGSMTSVDAKCNSDSPFLGEITAKGEFARRVGKFLKRKMKDQHPNFPGLPDGMPNPEALFESWWPIIIALGIGFVYGLRLYFRGARCQSLTKIEGKVAIITGGNTGIGKSIAEDFAKRGGKVYIACRDEALGEEAVKELKEKTKNENIRSMKCDLKSFKSIQSFVDAFKKKEENLHFLVNNAGVMMCPKSLTEDNFEEQFQVNYLGSVLLTHLLFDRLKKGVPSKVITTIANAYHLGEIDLDDISFEKKEYVPAQAYSQSKLALALFTKEFAKRYKFEDHGVTMNCTNPGIVRTGIHRFMPFRQSAFISMTFSPFLWFLMKCPEDGAQTVIFCCIADALETVTGQLYKECKRDSFDQVAENDELQEKLWTETMKWLDIKEFGKTEQ